MIIKILLARIKAIGLFFLYDIFFHVFGWADTLVGALGLAIGRLQ